MTLDLFYTRLERSGLGWFDHGAFTYSINSQREERVNQGGQGSNTAAIGHEPERTTSNGVQVALNKALSPRASLQVGGDVSVREADVGCVQHQSGDRRAIAAPSARAEQRHLHAGRRVRADRIRCGRGSSSAGRRGPRRRRQLRSQARATRRCRAASRCGRMIRSRPRASPSAPARSSRRARSRGRSSSSAPAAASARRT